tara:strand:- start:340 stop:633 length:294 start_codon:yes stop_codon:yes gene_type:complete
MKTLIKYAAFFLVCYLVLTSLTNKTECQPIKKVIKNSVNDFLTSDYPNLDVLDEVKEIMHWEVWDDTLRIYTIHDSIRDERLRWEYIRSLDDDDVWE